MNAIMAVWRKHDDNPAIQPQGMGLNIVGNDRQGTRFIDVQRITH